MESYIDDLRQRKNKAAGSAKESGAPTQKARLTAQERLDVLFDPNTFNEIDTLVTPRYEHYMDGRSSRYGDGVITGFGLINGRRVFAAAQDAAVMGGSLGEMHANKIVKAMQMALEVRLPLHCAQRLGRRAYPGRSRQPGGLRPHLRRQLRSVRRHPANLGDPRPVRRRRGLLTRRSPISSL